MCLSPITITTNSEKLDKNGTPLTIQVPCGKCAECRAQKQQDWAARCYYEWLYTKNKGGYAWFDTYTYNDQNIHKFHGVNCFDYTDFEKFVKRVRAHFQRKYGYSGNGWLRFMAVGEFGSLHSRPHYHAIWYIDKPIPLDEFWRVCRKYWTYGWNNAPKGEYCYKKYLVNDFAFCGYIAKYCTKSVNYNDFLNKIQSEVGKREFAKKFRCIHRASIGFGIGALTLNPTELTDLGKLQIPSKSEVKKVIKMPLYLRHKLFYDVEKNEKGQYRYKLNEKGIKLALTELPEKVDKMAMRYSDIYNNLETYLEQDINALTKWNVREIRHYIDQVLEDMDRDWYIFAVYKLVYKGVLWDDQKNFPDCYEVYEKRLRQSNKSLMNRKNNDFLTDMKLKSINQDSFNGEFHGFDDLSNVIDNVLYYYNSNKNKASKNKEKIQKKLKEFCDFL